MPTFGQQGPAFKERQKLKQYGINFSRFGIQYPPLRGTSRNPEFLLGPDVRILSHRMLLLNFHLRSAELFSTFQDFGFVATRKKIPGPEKGYQSLGYRKHRWSNTGIRRRAPTFVGQQLLLNQPLKQMPKRSPFGVTGERFPDPGEGAKESADAVPG